MNLHISFITVWRIERLCNIMVTLALILMSSAAISQNVSVTVKGHVRDNNGEPLRGASIVLAGTSIGATADESGNFSINITQTENAVLRVSYVGAVARDVPLDGKDFLNIELQRDAESIEEVIVTGYRTISRERVTGSFGVVSRSGIESKLQPDIKSILEGQVAGLTIDKDGMVEIRGVSTFSAVKTPLIVIDGYPVQTTLNDNNYFQFRDGTFENINTDNIENITVLKDAVATSIYGTRAANGVIVITTRGGVESEPKVSYRGIFNAVPVPDLGNLHKASSSDYIDAEIDLFNQNSSYALDYFDSPIPLTRTTYLLAQVYLDQITQAEADREIALLRNTDFLKQAKEYLFRPQLSHQHNIAINGGGKTHSYNLALKYIGVREHFVYSGSNRTTLDLNYKWNLNRYVSLRTSTGLNYSGTESPGMSADDIFQFYGITSSFTPYTALVDENGNHATLWGSQFKKREYENIPGAKNPDYVFLDDLNKERITTRDFQSRINATLHVDIFKGLSAEIGGQWLRGSYSYKQIYDEDSYSVRTAYTDGTSFTNPANHYIPSGGVINERRNINDSWTVRSQINFNRDFDNGRHRVNAIAGTEVARETYDNNTLATRFGYNPVAGTFVPVNLPALLAGNYTGDMYFPVSGAFTMTNGSYAYRDIRTSSWYGNASYEFDNRIIFSGSIRLDLTNFFGTSKKYRYKPHWSIGGTYKLDREKFFDIEWINRLNVRASHGVGGNIALNQGPFLVLSAGSYNTVTGGTSYGVSSPPNSELRWERTQTSNAGIDFSLFDHILNASVDYYYKYTTDCLAPDQLDPTTGFTSITKNVGSISNNGIEISINASVVRNSNFGWSITHNFAYNYNKVLTYNVRRNYATSYIVGAINHAGYPASGLWGSRFAGLNELGETQAYTKDGEVVPIGDLAAGDMVYLGSTRPRYDLSLTNRFKVQNWDLSFMFIAKLGHRYRKDAFSGSNIQNRHVGERWRKPGDEKHTIYPVINEWNSDMFYFPYVDALIGNASYAKLRDVTLSYTLGKNLTEKLNLGETKIYFQTRNLFTVKAKGTDIDPESFEINASGITGDYTDQGYSSLPLPVEFYIGIQISL
jgi:TonB-linked SusC/RagA family outer membrane protein